MDPEDLIDIDAIDPENDFCARPNWFWKLLLALWIFS